MAIIQQIKAAATAHIEVVYGFSDIKQRNMALGLYLESEVETAKNFISEVRNRCEELEYGATGEQELFEVVLAMFSDILPS